MATQNFVAGGFYGKLGAMVGQRWRNKRIVRAYAVPANPRTEMQQGNRARFAQACAAAQEALIFNKNAPCWQFENKTEWMARVGEAKTRIDNGITGWLAVPLYPSGTTPEMTVTDIESVTGEHGGVLLQSAQLATLTTSRKFTLQVKMLEQSSGNLVNVYLAGSTIAGAADLVEITPDSGYALTSDSTIVGITYDDAENDNKIIYIAPQKIEVPQNVLITDASLAYVDSTHVTITSEQARSLAYSYGFTVTLTLTNGLTGANTTKTTTASNTVGGATLATIEILETEVLYNNAEAAFTITSTPAGAPSLVINTAAASEGQKEISVTLASPVATLTAGARRAGTFTASGINASSSNKVTASITASFTDYLKTVHTNNIIASPAALAQTGTSLSIPVTFTEAPQVFDTTAVVISGYVENDWLKQTFSANAAIADNTQTKITLATFVCKPKGNYLGGYFALTAAQATLLAGRSFTCRVTGLQADTATSGTETPTGITASSGDSYLSSPHLNIELRKTWPVTNGQVLIYENDFVTAATAQYLDYSASLSAGKVSAAGNNFIAEYILDRDTDAQPYIYYDSATACRVDFGDSLSPFATTWTIASPTYSLDNSGNRQNINTGGSGTFNKNQNVLVSATLTENPDYDDDDYDYHYATATISNTMVNLTKSWQGGV